MNEPKISIVMPIYNVAPFLSQAIESLVKQSYQKLEILLIDDGSTDDSGKIADQFAKQDDRIKVYHKSNGGLSDSRNFGLARATGEYIYFPDSDDFLVSEFIATAVYNLTKSNADIFLVNFNLVNEAGNIIDMQRKTGAVDGVLSASSVIEMILNNELDNYIWQFVYQRQMLLDNNFSFMTGMVYEDIVATPTILSFAQQIVSSSQRLYNYRVRKNSIVHSVSLKKVQDLETMVSEFIKFTEAHKFGNPTLRAKFKFPLLMTSYLGQIKFANEVDHKHLEALRQEIITIHQKDLRPKELVKYWLIKTKLLQLVKNR